MWDGWPFTAKAVLLAERYQAAKSGGVVAMGETGVCMDCSDCGSNQASLCITCHEKKCVSVQRKRSASDRGKAVDERVPKRAHLHSDRQKLRVKMLGALPKIGTKRAKATKLPRLPSYQVTTNSSQHGGPDKWGTGRSSETRPSGVNVHSHVH